MIRCVASYRGELQEGPVAEIRVSVRQGCAPGTGPEGKPRAVLREYMGYIEQLDPEHAGKLMAEEGESTAAIRRRLGAAAQLLGRILEVTRDGRVVYFWEGEEDRPRRRGRPPRGAISG